MRDDINDKCKIFLDKQVPVHITRNDKSWANGFIKEVGSTFITLEEFKQGRLVIFFSEIYQIETYTKEIKE